MSESEQGEDRAGNQLDEHGGAQKPEGGAENLPAPPDNEESRATQGPDEGGAPANLPDDERWEHVDLSPEAQKRFNRIYRQLKQDRRVQRQLVEDNKKLLDRLDTLAADTRKQSADSRLDTLRRQEREAIEAGQTDLATELRDRITEIKVEETVAAKTRPNGAGQSPDQTHDQAPSQASDRGDLPEDVVEAVVEWSSERDGSGALVRPWAERDHPRFGELERTAAVVLERMRDADVDEITAEIDRLMGLQRPAQAPVLSGGGGKRRAASKTPKLTDEQKAVADRMGISHENYAKHLG